MDPEELDAIFTPLTADKRDAAASPQLSSSLTVLLKALRVQLHPNLPWIVWKVLRGESDAIRRSAASEFMEHVLQKKRSSSYMTHHPDLPIFVRCRGLHKLFTVFRTSHLLDEKISLAIALANLHKNFYSQFVERELLPFLSEQLSAKASASSNNLTECVQSLCACSGL
jgi:hypothetical protein